ncbi:acyl-CoA dehydrogenase family protein [Nocardia sp. NPDC058658]|uniref:acyl-CoA dehydrogenase family protein n=1 Tax=Nocardia sp. NPDC058658 TaxID=3346580 RepID=UPI0036679453
MEFELTADQRDLREAARKFSAKKLVEPFGGAEHHLMSVQLWRDCADFGVLGLPFPSEYGGADADPITVFALLEAMGEAGVAPGLLFALQAHMWAVTHPVARFGSDSQRARWLPGLIDGSLKGAHAATEPGAGSDIAAITTTLTPDSAGYRLNGVKTFVTNAPEADLFVVVARTHGSRGHTVVVVERNHPGVSAGNRLDTIGMEAAPVGEVVFDNTPVSANQVLGGHGRGSVVFGAAMRAERTFISAGTVGRMRREIEMCLAHVRLRRQYGCSLADFQAVSHRVADMQVRYQAARLLGYWAAADFESAAVTSAAASIAKVYISEAALQNGTDAVQLHGSAGYLRSGGVGQNVQAALAARIYSGTSEIQRNLIAAALGLA